MFPWPSFLSYVIIMAFTPGPNNIMSMNNARNAGFKKGLTFNFGVLAGGFILMILCLLFSAFLYSFIPKIQLPMKILGAAYMAYIIFLLFIPSGKHETKNYSGSFIVGMLFPLINPKAMMYGITAMSSFILPYYKEVPVLVLFAFFLAFTGFFSTICWALFGSLFSLLFTKHAKCLNFIMAMLLLYCIVTLFI